MVLHVTLRKVYVACHVSGFCLFVWRASLFCWGASLFCWGASLFCWGACLFCWGASSALNSRENLRLSQCFRIVRRLLTSFCSRLKCVIICVTTFCQPLTTLNRLQSLCTSAFWQHDNLKRNKYILYKCQVPVPCHPRLIIAERKQARPKVKGRARQMNPVFWEYIW